MDKIEELEFLNNQVNELPKEISEDINSEVIESQENKNDKVFQKLKTKVIDTSKETMQQVYQGLQRFKILRSLSILVEIIIFISPSALQKFKLALIFGISYWCIMNVIMNKNIVHYLLDTPSGLMISGLIIFLIGGILMFYIAKTYRTKTYRIKILRLLSILVEIIIFILPLALIFGISYWC